MSKRGASPEPSAKPSRRIYVFLEDTTKTVPAADQRAQPPAHPFLLQNYCYLKLHLSGDGVCACGSALLLIATQTFL